jgi:predicted GH43/DUF377 family glycosyl hydrolase
MNPGCARLRDGTLQLYPRLVAPGNISRIGSFRTYERPDGTLVVEDCGIALGPEAPYELGDQPEGHGCEDPRVTYISELDLYVMAYIALGSRGPRVAAAISVDGLTWERLGLLGCEAIEGSFADKDAAFFPQPVRSPAGVVSLAFYHRPTLAVSLREGQQAAPLLERLPPEQREGIHIGYVSLAAARKDIRNLCAVTESYRLSTPHAEWGRIKVGAGTPPVRIREGWLAVVHGVDVLEHPSGDSLLSYSAGIIVHDADCVDRVIYRSPTPLFVPEMPAELRGTVGNVVFPTAIDPRGDRAFDIYYGMADYAIGRGRLTLAP